MGWISFAALAIVLKGLYDSETTYFKVSDFGEYKIGLYWNEVAYQEALYDCYYAAMDWVLDSPGFNWDPTGVLHGFQHVLNVLYDVLEADKAEALLMSVSEISIPPIGLKLKLFDGEDLQDFRLTDDFITRMTPIACYTIVYGQDFFIEGYRCVRNKTGNNTIIYPGSEDFLYEDPENPGVFHPGTYYDPEKNLGDYTFISIAATFAWIAIFIKLLHSLGLTHTCSMFISGLYRTAQYKGYQKELLDAIENVDSNDEVLTAMETLFNRLKKLGWRAFG